MTNDNAEVGKRLEEIRDRADKATPGPWMRDTQVGMIAVSRRVLGYVRTVFVHGAYEVTAQDWENGDFIAHARTDIPYLLSLNEALAERVRALSEELGKYLGQKYLAEQGLTEPIRLEFTEEQPPL